eukprot:gene14546-biopygen8297
MFSGTGAHRAGDQRGGPARRRDDQAAARYHRACCSLYAPSLLWRQTPPARAGARGSPPKVRTAGALDTLLGAAGTAASGALRAAVPPVQIRTKLRRQPDVRNLAEQGCRMVPFSTEQHCAASWHPGAHHLQAEGAARLHALMTLRHRGTRCLRDDVDTITWGARGKTSDSPGVAWVSLRPSHHDALRP